MQPVLSSPDEKKISNVFIREFVRQLIINSKPKSSMSDELLQRIKSRMAQEIPLPSAEQKLVSSSQPPSIKAGIDISKPQINPRPLPPRRMQFPVPARMGQMPPRRMPLLSQPTKIAAPAVQSQPQQPAIESIAKLRPFLSDPSVISVECPGEGKNINLNRSGITHSVQLSLTKEEIDAILSEFSSKTKIPLLPGVFKAIYSGLLMTAVISDSIGSRFIIEKQFTAPKLPTQEKK